jgi:hypothetical protein
VGAFREQGVGGVPGAEEAQQDLPGGWAAGPTVCPAICSGAM